MFKNKVLQNHDKSLLYKVTEKYCVRIFQCFQHECHKINIFKCFLFCVCSTTKNRKQCYKVIPYSSLPPRPTRYTSYDRTHHTKRLIRYVLLQLFEEVMHFSNRHSYFAFFILLAHTKRVVKKNIQNLINSFKRFFC